MSINTTNTPAKILKGFPLTPILVTDMAAMASVYLLYIGRLHEHLSLFGLAKLKV